MSGKTEHNFTYRKIDIPFLWLFKLPLPDYAQKKPFFSSSIVSRQPSVFPKPEPHKYRLGSIS